MLQETFPHSFLIIFPYYLVFHNHKNEEGFTKLNIKIHFLKQGNISLSRTYTHVDWFSYSITILFFFWFGCQNCTSYIYNRLMILVVFILFLDFIRKIHEVLRFLSQHATLCSYSIAAAAAAKTMKFLLLCSLHISAGKKHGLKEDSKELCCKITWESEGSRQL